MLLNLLFASQQFCAMCAVLFILFGTIHNCEVSRLQRFRGWGGRERERERESGREGGREREREGGREREREREREKFLLRCHAVWKWCISK